MVILHRDARCVVRGACLRRGREGDRECAGVGVGWVVLECDDDVACLCGGLCHVCLLAQKGKVSIHLS